jgi:hypothetical protein
MNNAYLLQGLESTSRVLTLLLNRLDVNATDIATGPGRFSPREVIAHLADWEPIFLARMRKAIGQPGIAVEAFDEGELAQTNRYAEKDWQEELVRFDRARRETIAFLRELSPDQWDVAFLHPENGPMTIDDQAAMLLGHDHYHLEQLSEVLDRQFVS